MINLNEYFCSVPFKNLEIHNKVCFACCPSWLPNKIETSEIPLKDIWNSEPLIDIRNSILDGSFKYCDKQLCPYLSKLINFGETSGPLQKKSDSTIDSPILDFGPKVLVMNFDRTCNYKCPSCRVDLIVEDKKGIQRVEKTIEEIDTFYSRDVKTLYITGSGDPFISVGFRNYLRNFDPKKYPKLKSIHFHTNASMWNKEMWESMPNIHKYVTTCEISIDAGTKETYENITRLGGDWGNLLSNLKFIATIPSLKKVKTSFVVQQSNYLEMGVFLDTMKSIFGIKSKVFFGKINNWGTFTSGQFEFLKIWDPKHPEHTNFLNEFNKIAKDPYVFHNLHEFLNIKKSII